MADVLGILGFIGTVVGFIEVTARSSTIIQKSRHELTRQWQDYDVIRLILQEAVDEISNHGKPSPVITATLQQCADRAQAFESELIRTQDALQKRGRRKRLVAIARVGTRRHQRQFAFDAFRDSVLLLRDLVHSMHTRRQLNSVMSDLIEGNAANDGDIDSDSVKTWNPRQYQENTGLDLEDITKSKVRHEAGQRPLRNALIKSNYTFDATIAKETDQGIKYIPVRGLWDTGSNAFMISREILTRAGITDVETNHVDDTTVSGIGGTSCHPKFSINLTWHVNRNMNSRQDLFYVHEEDSQFDILVPYTLLIGSRHTGMRDDDYTTLVVGLRRKTQAERQQEKIDEQTALKNAEESKKKRLEDEAKAREALIKQREAAAATSAAPAPSQTNTNSSKP